VKIKTIELSNIEQVNTHLLGYSSGWMFRGHSQASWSLESTLERELSSFGWNAEVAAELENISIQIFQSKAQHYITKDSLPTTKLGWLSLMQHHGCPTRLLDFTESPFVALFFAFEGMQMDLDKKCVVWAINFRELMQNSIDFLHKYSPFPYTYNSAQYHQDEIFDKHIDTFKYDILWVTEPKIYNHRLEKQRGTFLLSCNIDKRIAELLDSIPTTNPIQKLVIPASLCREVYKSLNLMGICNANLFSDIDGVARDIGDYMLDRVNNTIFEQLHNLNEK
jgi:hypothetical protein